MSELLSDLEGAEEDLIGDADLSEWNILLEADNSETSLDVVQSKPSVTSASKDQSQDEKKDKCVVETTLKEPTIPEEAQQIDEKSALQNLDQQTASQPESKPQNIVISGSDLIKTSVSVNTGQTDRNQSHLAHGNIQKDKSTHHSSKLSPTKHKLTEVDNNDPKVQKLDNVSDIVIAIGGDERVEHSPKEVEDMDVETVIPGSIGGKVSIMSEEESRNIDNWFVEDIVEEIKQELIPQKDDKFIVRFSPVELADLANSSVQDLIQTNPNLAFYFKRQGKFKKKKGFAESYYSKSADVKVFIQKLMFIQLVETKMEVSVTYINRTKEPVVVSFVVSLNKTNYFFKLVKNPEESNKGKPETKAHFEIQKVPAAALTFVLETIFPYSNSVSMPTSKGPSTEQYKGPVTVNYVSDHWIEAMLECCTDFAYESFPLTILPAAKEAVVKSKSAVKTDVEAKKEEQLSEKSKRSDGSKAVQESSASVGSSISDSPQESSKDRPIDADISSMTLDVCTGMLESINKLKQLGTDNPNILKILEMHAQLATLQESLSHTGSSKTKASSSDEQTSDPWTISPSDTVSQTAEQGSEKKRSKKEKKKLEEDLRAKKQKKELEDLQRRLEEADEAERQREENIKHQREMELQQSRAADEKAKSNWARKLIEDAKLAGNPMTGDSTATKMEAQRMLKAREERLKGEEEAKLKEEMRRQNEAALKQESDKKLDVPQDQVLSSDADNSGPSQDDILASSSKADVGENSNSKTIVYSEQEYEQLTSTSTALPADYLVQLTYFTNRRCPVSECPATTFFKTESSFIDHWEIFHKPNVTMRFCNSCSAYFMNVTELESHLMKRHGYINPKTVSQLVTSARVKCVTNPSYRCPGKYLGP